MLDKNLRILLISHESSLSGAPILLLNFIRLLKSQGYTKLFLIIRRGGPLDDYFLQELPCVILKPSNYHKSRSILKKLFQFAGYRIRLWKLQRLVHKYDLIFNNTITNGNLLQNLSVSGVPVVTYIHELKEVMKLYEVSNDTQLTISLSNAFFSPGSAVTLNLINNYNVSPDNIFTLPYYFNDISENIVEMRKERRKVFCEMHHIPEDDFLVVAKGSANLRKGVDLFVQIAFLNKNKRMRFIWIGDFLEEDVKQKVHSEIRSLGLDDKVILTGNRPIDRLDLLPFDVLCLTSREDPYPLVVLEAAYLEIPTVCFEGAGGIGEFVSKGGGIIVPKGSTTEFAKALERLFLDKALRLSLGRQARLNALEMHAKPDSIITKFRTCVESLGIGV